MDIKPLGNKNQKLWILLGVLAVIVIIIIVAASQGSNPVNQANNTAPVNTDQTSNSAEQTTEASQTTKGGPTSGTSTPENQALKNAVVVVPGANPISKDNKVVTASGEVTKNDVAASSVLAPHQTLAVTQESLSSSVVKLEVSAAGGFSPNSFTVKAGAPVTVSITNKESGRSASLAFTDPSLLAVIIGTPPLETRAITFNAPTKVGEYEFIDGIPGHNASGKMIVK